MYNCKYCNKEFKDKGNLRRHEKYNHEISIEKVSCPFCNEFFEKCGIHTHVKSCKSNPDRYISKYELESKDKSYRDLPGNCRYCGKECKNRNSLSNHERLCKNNPNRQFTIMHSVEWQNEMRSRIDRSNPWNKGLTKYTDERIAKGVEAVKQYYETHDGSFKGKHHSEETKSKIREFAIENESHKNFGRHKNFVYNGVNFQSSYELIVAMDLELNHVRWESAKRLPYIDNKGLNHYYTADLYLPDYDVYLDPKNDFLIENINPYFGYKDVDKINWVCEQNNVKILILNKDQLEWRVIEQLIRETIE